MSTIATHLMLARKGLNKIIMNMVRDPKGLYGPLMGFRDISTTESFIRMSQKTGLGMLSSISEGDPHPEADFSVIYQKDYAWTIYALKYSQTKEKAAADQYGVNTAASIGRDLKTSVVQTENVLAAAVFNNGTSAAADYAGSDGVALFSYAHPLASGTSSNRGNGVTDADISQTEIGNAIQQLMMQKAHKGEPFLAAGPYTLVVPPQNMITAETIRKSMLASGTANNDANIAGGMLDGVVVNPYLTDPDSWFLVDKEASGGGLHRIIFMAETDTDAWEDNDRRMVHYSVVIRRSYGHNNWRGVWGSFGA